MDHAELLSMIEASGPELREVLTAAMTRGLGPLQIRSPMRCSEWAAKHFYLSAESSYEEQRWTAYPFQPDILDAMGSDEIEECDFIKSARVGYTKMGLANIAYQAEHKHRNQVLYQPTDDDRDEFVTTELDPMLRDVRALRRVFPKFNRKSKENTLKVKRFLGCLLHLRGGKAAKNYRRLTVDTATIDELDGFDTDIEKEGSPDKLAWKRSEGAVYRKLICGSTPKIKGHSMIEARHDRAELRMKFHVPCQHCDEFMPLLWGGKDLAVGMKWVNDDPETVAHVCPHCAGLMTQADYLQVWGRGRWIAQDGTWIAPGFKFVLADGSPRLPPRHIAFHIWTAYSPQTTWSAIVREFLDARAKAARGDKSDLKTFVNLTLGESWEEEVERTESSLLAKRARLDRNPYRMGTVPRGACVLVASIDQQGSWWQVNVWGRGRGDETWLVDRIIIEGNLADLREWDAKLLPVLERQYQHQDGQSIGIRASAVDTGGHFTHQAYAWVRANPGRNLYATKGESTEGKPIKSRRSYVDVNERGRVIKRGVALWFIGTDTAKDLIYGRLQVAEAGPGYVHFPVDTPDDFFKQLTSEARMTQRTARGETTRWIKPAGVRNEDLDCTVMAEFAAQMLDLHKWSDAMWRRLEDSLQPDLFAMVQAAPQPPIEVDEEAEPDHGDAPKVTAGEVKPAAPQQAARQQAAPAHRRIPAAAAASIGSNEWSSTL